jgi:protein tyrosine phosphatase (PTP) superfamily phosphohydrolase (DUF442 family)
MIRFFGVLGVCLLGVAGCQTYPSQPPIYYPQGQLPQTMIPGQPGTTTLPPGYSNGQAGFPSQGSPFMQPQSSMGMPPAPYPPPTNGQGYKVDYGWRPADVKLYPPQGNLEQPKFTDQTPKPSSEPPVIKEQTVRGSLPVAIPGFAAVREKISAGLRPSSDEGLVWLADNGYKTVLVLHGPGEDTNPERLRVEKRGLQFLSLEISPQNLNKETVDSFNAIVNQTGNHPLFVFDRDGSMAGAMWYLHFRTAEQLSDDLSRLRANGLGLREDRDGMHKQMWLAAQKVLAN